MFRFLDSYSTLHLYIENVAVDLLMNCDKIVCRNKFPRADPSNCHWWLSFLVLENPPSIKVCGYGPYDDWGFSSVASIPTDICLQWPILTISVSLNSCSDDREKWPPFLSTRAWNKYYKQHHFRESKLKLSKDIPIHFLKN